MCLQGTGDPAKELGRNSMTWFKCGQDQEFDRLVSI